MIAHRGSSALAPELTLASYLQAVEDNADGFECDVQLTKDQIPVCFHDSTLTRTSSGFGRLGSNSLEDLKRLDFGSWFGFKPAKYSDKEWQSILTLAELSDFTSKQSSNRVLLVETKHISQNGVRLESKTLQTLNQFGLIHNDPSKPRAALMSFSIPALRRARNISPDLYTVLLLDRKLPKLSILSDFVNCNAWGLGVHLLRTDPKLVIEARSIGKAVFVWTVNNPQQLELCQKYKVDVIITDFPHIMKTLIKKDTN